MSEHVDLVVVGGGVTGLAAAWEAAGRGAAVVVLEASGKPGGKLGTSPVGGFLVDESADAFLARRPEAVTLCAELGIEDQLVAPATGQAYLWVPDDLTLRRLPTEQLLGVPTDVEAVASSGILSSEGIEELVTRQRRWASDTPNPPGAESKADRAVGELTREQLGDEVHERLVAPLLGGIWVGDCDRLSVDVAAPALAEASRRNADLVRGARAVRAAAPGDQEPVFLAPEGGMVTLVEALVEGLGDTRVRVDQPVASIEPVNSSHSSAGWRIEPEGITADAVVVATPAWVSAGLVEPHSSRAGHWLATIEHASVALVTLAVPRDGIHHPQDGSGFLVPASAGLVLTACSWASSKWQRLGVDDSTVILRASAGRDGDQWPLELDDEELVRRLCADLRLTMGLEAEPQEVRIDRFWQGLPQPRPGHLDLVADIESALAADAPNLAVAGAWARGVGIPACIASGRDAAARLLTRR